LRRSRRTAECIRKVGSAALLDELAALSFFALRLLEPAF